MQFQYFLASRKSYRLAMLAGLAAIACDGSDNPMEPDEESPPTFSVERQTPDVWMQPAGTVVSTSWGTATLIRNLQGLQVQVSVTDPALQAALAGKAVTIWVGSFHNPQNCAPNPAAGVCQTSDLANNLTGGAQQRVDGMVLGNGPFNFMVNVWEGDTSEQNAGTASGLVDADTDEIHFVIRSHGLPITGMVDQQTHLLQGGCSTSNPCTNNAVVVFRLSGNCQPGYLAPALAVGVR